MRVLLPVHQVRAGGGIGTYARGLAPALVAAASGRHELVVEEGRPGAGAAGAASLGSLRRLVHEQSGLARLARSADLVHLVDSRPLLASRTPFIATLHDVTFLDHPEWFPARATRYKRAMLGALLRRGPEAVVCVSRYARDRLVAHHPRAAGRAVVIAPGLEPPPAAPSAQPQRGEPYFLTVSAIEPRKNHLGLLDGFLRARARGLRATWRVVGRPGYRAEPILAALRAADGVDLAGGVTDDELEALYRGALFAVTPSHAEGFGYPPLEAMARGVPTAVARGTALDETAADAALRVDPGDPDGWAAALLELERDAATRAELRARGLRRAEAFSWAAAAAAHVDLYDATAGTRSAAR